MYHRHHDGSRDSLSAHVPYDEEEFPVPYEEIEDVPSHFPGGLEGPEYVNIGAVRERREFLGQHLFLDTPRDMEFIADPCLVHIGIPESLLVPCEPLNHQEQGRQRNQGQEEIDEPVLADIPVKLLFKDNLGDLPLRLVFP